MRLFYSNYFFDPIRIFRDIKLFLENIFQKTLYLKNGKSDQKEFWIKKAAKFNFASFLFKPLFYPIRRFRDIKLFLENIFQKTLYLGNGEWDQKKVLNKKDSTLNFASFLFITLFWSDSPFSRYKAFFGKYFPKNALSQKRRIKSKNVLNKKDAKLNFPSFLFRTLFWSDSPFSRY